MKGIKSFTYPYGNHYDVGREKPNRISDEVIIYASVKNEPRKIGSLEGIFVSLESLPANGNYICKRNQMKDFESEHRGKFFPFKK
jgi:hypothetical protein